MMQWPEVVTLVLALVTLAASITVAQVFAVNSRAWDSVPTAALWIGAVAAMAMLAAAPLSWTLGWSIVDGSQSPQFTWIVVSLVAYAAISIIRRRAKSSRMRYASVAVIVLSAASAVLVCNSDLNGEAEYAASTWRTNGHTPWRATLTDRDEAGTGDLRIIAHSRSALVGVVTRKVYDRTFVVNLVPKAQVTLGFRSDSVGDHALVKFGDIELDDVVLPGS